MNNKWPQAPTYRSRPRIRSRRLLFLLGAVALVALIWSFSNRALPTSSGSESRALLPGVSAGQPDGSAAPPAGTGRYKIVVDAGHGGFDPGADGASGDEEKDFTLSLATKVADLLRQEPDMFEVHMTRTDDTYIELENRSGMANAMGADAFISIHGNTFVEDPKVSGTESYYYDSGSQALAQAIHGPLLEALGFRDRGVKKEGWKVLTTSQVPATLLEIGFLTNPAEEAKLLEPETQDRAAQAIVNGLKQYLQKADVQQ
ncbi:N-acetylmuramoyl-L-alanine amidase family protein [Cohnella nanjingensis]|uniref:N-acetylmuramoyl-L-alanine amidase n=1 Tax=Cohnella nanjingensis TaxID=1387779 RepID=A0A7X0RTI9_9BACL|nr:N-acetylmuramoyl-L-alanine amidase [Cohnella nanjingensis]MBB6672120.1 N-acetylmuramoyl-L-alanine amidase [Cohnella nanjingensis]